MDVATRKHLPTVRLRRLAYQLRGMRSDAGLTREDAAEKTHMNSATLWRIETGKVRPQKRTVLALLDLYGISDEQQRTEMLDLLKDSTQLGWLQAYEEVLSDEYSAYISFEAEARSVRNYEPLFVPGLLQTEEYARAVTAGVLPECSESDVAHRVEARMKRQESITKDTPLKLWAIIDEGVIHRQVGGVDVIRGQLRHLADMAKQPHITLQVLPYEVGAHAGMHGAFALMDFPDPYDPELVYIENRVNAMFLESPSEIASYSSLFEYLRAAAVDPAGSVRMIKKSIDRMDEKGR
ncbi:helix-turn-helix domain-containing protein [Micromonospora sp. LOL_023]|uniref:helix-turn-helix domain-containing protein n=1 Tax=Micromonospora sp. LOL_023 TaxID=3345418 RepID=UPI003A8BA7E0